MARYMCTCKLHSKWSCQEENLHHFILQEQLWNLCITSRFMHNQKWVGISLDSFFPMHMSLVMRLHGSWADLSPGSVSLYKVFTTSPVRVMMVSKNLKSSILNEWTIHTSINVKYIMLLWNTVPQRRCQPLSAFLFRSFCTLSRSNPAD